MVDYFTAETDQVRFAVDGRLGLIELNRPKAINALTWEMVDALNRQLDEWAEDDAIATVAITGAGDRGLCAGGDVRSIREAILAGDLESPTNFWRDEYRLNATIADYPKPYVAIMDGVVMGGGVGVSVHGQVRLVTERTKIAMPETIIGLFPDVGAMWWLSRAPQNFGVHMALTGTTIDGPTAIAIGFADAQIDSQQIPEVLATLGRGESIDHFLSTPAAEPFGDWLQAYDSTDPVQILRQLRASSDPAARTAAEDMAKRSPYSVAVTLAALRRAATMSSVNEVLDQDFVLGKHFLGNPDFVEGVRAQLVDKDRNPTWRHSSFDQVTDDEVAAAFED